jgi:hypothetical protein
MRVPCCCCAARVDRLRAEPSREVARLVRFVCPEGEMRTRTVVPLVLAWVILGTTGSAGVTWRPAPMPSVSAASADWYQAREPILVAGEWYYPAGATRFFDRFAMVQVGSYGGVPLYADTTLEPHSILYVPIGRGLLQPYERPRAGPLAGTVGSRTPSFPVQRDFGVRYAVRYWDHLYLPAFDPPAPRVPARAAAREAREEPPANTSAGVLQSVRSQEGSWGVWVWYGGARWVSDGRAVAFDAEAFDRIGDYHGFPVFRSREAYDADVVYLPSREGVLAPYRRSGE